MRKMAIFTLAMVLVFGVGYAAAQEAGPKPGDMPQSLPMGGQPPAMGQGSLTNPQLMQQMQDTMQQMQTMMQKPKMTPAETKKLQDMLNQMQGVMNQMQINTMMQMCGACPMMKQLPQGSSMPPSGAPGTPSAGSPPPGSPSPGAAPEEKK